MYKLLVADDEGIERMVLCKILKKQVGNLCEIYEAKSGKEAIQIFEEKKIQIAILDIEMPGINGLEAARRIREQNENCVLLFLTAFDEFSYAKQAITVKALDYLLKPYDEKELIFAVEEAMRLVDKNYRNNPQIMEMPNGMKDGKIGDVRLCVVKERIENYIENHYAEDISVYEIAHEMNYSEPYFCKLFKQCFHVNFTSYLAEYRVETAKKMLEDPLVSIKDVGKASGYGDSNYFSRVFKRVAGCTPTEYRIQIMNEKRIKLY